MQREEGAGGRKGAEDHRLVKSMCACQKTSFPGDEMGAKRQVNLFCVFFTGVKKKSYHKTSGVTRMEARYASSSTQQEM